jgi:segregation and condensation protein A
METSPTYQVKTEVFDGPLDLLLSLVEKRKLFINDISLAKVADDYIAYVRSLDQFPMADATGFVLVASVLVLIKSKSLLPKLDFNEEETASIDELQDRLKKYQRYKELSIQIGKMFGKEMIFPRIHVSKQMQPIFTPEPSITQENILSAVYSAMSKVPKPEKLQQKTISRVMRLEEMIDRLSERVNRELRLSFHEFSGHGKAEKIQVVVSFLAMLELVKMGSIMVRQDDMFSEITMETMTIKTPEY